MSTTGRPLLIIGHLRVTGHLRDTGHHRDSGRRGTGRHRAADHRALVALLAGGLREHGHRAQHRAQHRAHHQEVVDREGAARK